MHFDKLIKSLSDLKEIIKSTYGPKDYKLYNQADNIRRKAKNVEENVIEGPNKNTKKYTSSMHGTARQQASREDAAIRRKNKQQPVKTFNPQEIAAEAAKRGLGVSAKKSEKTTFNERGQWSMNKIGGYGTAVTAVGGQSSGLPFGAANKAEKDPHAKPVYHPEIIKPEDVKDVGAQGFALKLPKNKKNKHTK